MFPNLFGIGPFQLHTYGFCIMLGVLLSWKVIERLDGRKDLSNLIMLLVLCGFVGSRIAYVIEHWQTEFAANPLQVVRIDQGGLMFYGGFILSFAVFFVWCFAKRENPLKLADLLAAVIPLAHAFGRIGCFFYGCCYGRDSDCWCAVTFPAGSPSWYEHGHKLVSVLPTQLFEAAALLCLFGGLMWVWRGRRTEDGRRWGDGLITGLYLSGYAVIRFGIEILRGDPRAAVGPFSISQTISIGMISVGSLFIFNAMRRRVSGK